jgi:hypothetical protein
MALMIVAAAVVQGEPVAVRQAEGLVHGFLRLSTLDGRALATGDLLQTTRGDQVTSRLVFRFLDGSVRDETSVFTQRRRFHLVSNHLVQKGPTFDQPLEMTVDGGTGQVVVHYDDHGSTKSVVEHFTLPDDLANGLTMVLLKNVKPDAVPASLSLIVATPKPRLVKLRITHAGDDPFSLGPTRRKAIHYIVKIDLGGIVGLVAPLIGKQPPDSHVWILDGEAPAFVKSEGPMSADTPPWRIELLSPVWPDERVTEDARPRPRATTGSKP